MSVEILKVVLFLHEFSLSVSDECFLLFHSLLLLSQNKVGHFAENLLIGERKKGKKI